MNRKVGRIVTILLFLFATSRLHPSTTSCGHAQNSVSPATLAFTVYFDGYVFVDYELAVNQTYPIVNVTLIGRDFENLLVTDGQGLPLDHSQVQNKTIIQSLGADQVRITYFTAELTSKVGKIWTLASEVPIRTTVMLPVDASIISLGTVPELIESHDEKVILVMSAGLLEISYVVTAQFSQQPVNYEVLALAIASSAIVALAAYWLLKRLLPHLKEKTPHVNVGQIYAGHKDLRPEEKEAIRILAERNGKTYEAELFERLNLPRTSTWRLIRRLERMEIVDITKSRRQNVVSIKKKYLT